MKLSIFPLLVAGLAATSWAGDSATPELDRESRVLLERMIETRGFTRGIPRDALPAPDGGQVYFLCSGPKDAHQRLLAFEVATARVRVVVDATTLGAPGTISAEEQARRERQRQTERGVTGFEISDDGTWLLVPLGGDPWIVEASGGNARRLAETPEPELDPHLSPDGRWVSYLRGNDLFVREVAGAREVTVAASDDPGIAWGAAEFVAQEEMHRSTGHWWSPDSRSLAFTRVDVRGVPSFEVPDFNDPNGAGRSAPYPKPGDPNAVVSLHVLRIGDAAGPRQLDLGDDVEYLARVHWAPASDALWVETQPRSQRRLDVRRIDLGSGAGRVVLRESDRDWVNLHDDFRFLAGGARFLWSSERSGHRHLEVVDAASGERQAITTGTWSVAKVVDVDEERGTVTFTGSRDGPAERHLYRVPLAGGRLERLSREPGWHEAAFHRLGHEVYAETFSDDRHPPQVRVFDREGSLRGTLPSEALVPSPEDLGPVPLYMELTSPAGEPLSVRLVQPPSRPDGARLPLVVYVYSGPGSQLVRRAWPGERGLFEGWLANRGFAVARIDGRGTEPRGHDSERIYARRLGQKEIADQATGVGLLLQRFSELDPERVGIWGWSYGGYATLMALAQAPQIFRAGVAVAPVVDWRGYDSHYSERYLGLPAENPAGYDSSAVLPWADRIHGRLVLIHGTTDDNVHFRESMRLVGQLVRLGRQFDLMVYPGTHMMQSLEERLHLYELVWRSFAENL